MFGTMTQYFHLKPMTDQRFEFLKSRWRMAAILKNRHNGSTDRYKILYNGAFYPLNPAKDKNLNT